MLDIHVILFNKDLMARRRCISSIKLAMSQVDFPICLHEVEGVVGHIGAGRAMGYSLGVFPYVTCVDDDDFILPHALLNLKPGMLANTNAVSTLEAVLENNYFLPGAQRHHLIAYKREVIIDHSAWAALGDPAQIKSINQADWFDVSSIGYLWHKYSSSSGRALRHSHPKEFEKLYA